MPKTPGHFTTQIPDAHPIQWQRHPGDLDAFVLDVLGTLGREGAAVWYPMTVYTFRMIQAARLRLWRQGGAAVRCRTDVETDRIYVRADFSTARAFTAWSRQATVRGTPVSRLRLVGRKRRPRRAA